MAVEDRVLIVDDEEPMLLMLAEHLTAEGLLVETYRRPEDALARLVEAEADLVITDLRMPDMDGLEVVARARALRPATPVVIMTAFGSIPSAIEAMKRGAFHYVTKPFKLDEIDLIVQRALEDRRLRAENLRLRAELDRRYSFANLIGKSPKMQEVFDLLRRIAPGSGNLLIYGESGTGKELVARAIHQHSARGGGPFVPVNCAAIPEALLESELLGYTKGAFTGAHASRKGLLEEADGGTIFLDEIGDMPPSLQAKLLRVIDDKEVRPLGGGRPKRVDFRVIAATHRDLEALVAQGSFREDLYYRLNVITVTLPPLRSRPEDIPPLAEHFIAKYAQALGRTVQGLSPRALAALERYPWKGNVRELENAIERAVTLGRGPIIEIDDLPPAIRDSPRDAITHALNQGLTLRELEDRYIARVLEEVGGDRQKAAELLGVHPRTLLRRDRRLQRPGPPGT